MMRVMVRVEVHGVQVTAAATGRVVALAAAAAILAMPTDGSESFQPAEAAELGKWRCESGRSKQGVQVKGTAPRSHAL